MADTGAVRQRRYEHHRRGDHSLCRNCKAIRENRPLTVVAVDPLVALRASAARLMAVCEDDPRNVQAAHELRLTVAELARLQPDGADLMDELVAMSREVS
jgi:hypothetical protein